MGTLEKLVCEPIRFHEGGAVGSHVVAFMHVCRASVLKARRRTLHVVRSGARLSLSRMAAAVLGDRNF